jgi:hypothetical protein
MYYNAGVGIVNTEVVGWLPKKSLFLCTAVTPVLISCLLLPNIFYIPISLRGHRNRGFGQGDQTSS